eukprot:scaffold106555_cov33-Tisochrysis_lutea.AAC.2
MSDQRLQCLSWHVPVSADRQLTKECGDHSSTGGLHSAPVRCALPSWVWRAHFQRHRHAGWRASRRLCMGADGVASI